MRVYELAAVIMAAMVASAAAAAAQGFPSKTIKLIVGVAPGGGADGIARLLAVRMENDLGVSVIVENRPGAAGVIAARSVAQSEPDGHTIMLFNSSIAIQHGVSPDPTLDLLNVIEPIGQIATSPLFLVAGPKDPVSSVTEFVDLARSRPGEITYSSSGTGSVLHLIAAAFGQKANIDLRHIPFQGGGAESVAIMAGEVNASFKTGSFVIPMLEEKKARVLAITSKERDSAFPDVPTFAEAGIDDFEYSLWFGVVGPKGMPSDVVERLNASLVAAAANQEFKKALADQVITAEAKKPEEFWESVKAFVKVAEDFTKSGGMK